MIRRILFIVFFIYISVAIAPNIGYTFVKVDIEKVTQDVSNELKSSMKVVVDDTVKSVKEGIDKQVESIKQAVDDNIGGINDKLTNLQKTFDLIVWLLIALVSILGFIVVILIVMLLVKLLNNIMYFYSKRKKKKSKTS